MNWTEVEFRMFRGCVVLWCLSLSCQAQAQSQPEPAPERWNLFYQATSIGQYHGTFHSPYSGPFSLQDYPERDVSLTTTLFFGLRLEKNTGLYFDPEIAGGRGFSGVNGMANPSNGELPRVASATPKPYLARLYVSHDVGFGGEMESLESQANQLGGQRPMTRYTLTLGRFTVTDFFDNNRYTHDPRTQFMGWGVMYNGAWDYPADVRGYTWGWVHEFHARNWSLRYASAAMPRVANGLRFDRRLFRNRGDVFEGEYRYKVSQHAGAIRVLHYQNRANAGTYAEAIRQAEWNGGPPVVTDTRRNGTLKYGFGLNLEQELTKDIGIFARLGRKDGKLRIHGHRSRGHWGNLDRRAALASFVRHGGYGIHGLGNLRRPCALPGARRLRFSDRRWPAAVRAGVHLGELLPRAADPGPLRELRSAARFEPRLQPGARPGVDSRS